MKNNLIFFIYVVLFFSCVKKQKIYYYPTVEKINNLKNRDTIFLENFSDFDDLIKNLYKIQKENGKQPIIPIKDNSNIYYLNPIEYGNTCHLPSRVRRKNKLLIAKDSIMKNGIMFPISKLEYLLRKDLFNNNKEIEFAENHKNLIISFLEEEGIQSIEDLRNCLLRTFKVFNKINDKDTLELNIDLNKSIIIPPPPSCNLIKNKVL